MNNRFVGVDLGGTKIAAAMFNSDTETLSSELVVPTRAHEGPDGVLRQIAEVVQEVCEKTEVPTGEIDGVGIGMPATFDFEKGQTLLLPNIPGDWWGKPVADILRDYLDVPIALVNDARSFTLAEANLGAGRGYDCVVGITLGTGIGGGIVIGGKLHMGLSGSAGEVGHHSVDLYGTPDGSDNPGALEAYASGPAIAAMGVKAVMQGLDTIIGRLVDFNLNKITPGVILKAAENDDHIAQDILRQAGDYLGAGLANILIIVEPHCVVIGGGVAELGEWLLKPMRESAQRRCGKVVPFDRVVITQAKLGAQAGVIGAALQAHQQFAGT